MALGFPPVAMHCEVCQLPCMTWQCYTCGSTYCGFCAGRHVWGAPDRDELVRGGIAFANEVAEGLLFFVVEEVSACCF